ncbi:MAG: hypothetical protein HZC17_03065, partial [Candidatus Omnitrophica bacterium]|nr:hypothetical protein [Candidatus Omnitrophota bacterium]
MLQLAQTQGQATAQIESQLQSAIQSINQQRQYLYDHQRQITFRKILFFKIPVYGKIDISPQLRQLDEMERQARDAASEQLALLDAEVALQKQKIEDDAGTALAELEKQRQTTYAEIIKQELRPVVLHYYRKVLGRDPDQAEISSQLSALSIQLERIDVQALQNSLSASQEFQTRSASVASIKQAVRDFLVNQYLKQDQAGRDQLLASLGLTSADVITQSPAEIDTILAWLDSRDLHFGHSAFYALRQLLEEGGKQVDFNQLARDSIL